jgi:hypothetical protein
VPHPVLHQHGPDPAGLALQPYRAGAEHHLDAALLVHQPVVLGDHRCHDPAHQPVGDLDDRHLAAQHPCRRRNLEPDEAAADHGYAGAGEKPAAQLLGLVQRAQVEHAVELGPLDRQRPHPCAGGEEEGVKGEM